MQKNVKEKLKKIEEQISKIIPEQISEEWISETFNIDKNVYKNDFFNRISDFLQKINNPGIELLNRGGKRWRPLLMLLCCEIAGGKEEDAIPLTPIVEIVHNGTLIIDDIEDNSEHRRGKPAVHKLFGIDMSINTANLMYFLPTCIIDSCSMTNTKKNLVYKYFHDNMRRLHLGQGLDILWHKDHLYIPDKDEYIFMCKSKTGCLSRMAAEIGAEIGSAETSGSYVKILGEISENLGVVFQILDDVKNLTTGNPGKRKGDDIVEGKKSLPIILFHKNNPDSFPRLIELIDSASKKGYEKSGKEINEAIEFLSSSGSIEQAKSYASSLLEQINIDIDDNFKGSVASLLLKDLLLSLLK